MPNECAASILKIKPLGDYSCKFQTLKECCTSQRQPLSHLAVITACEKLWKELADAKEADGFLELPRSISKIFPKARSGKLLIRDAYKILLRVFERRSGVMLVQPEYYASIASESEEVSPSPAKKQKTGKLSLNLNIQNHYSCQGNLFIHIHLQFIYTGAPPISHPSSFYYCSL